MIAAVVNFKTAPSFFMLGTTGDNPNTVAWSFKDRLLTLAVLQLESEKCPHCGIPYWHGSTADGRVGFKVEWRVCYGCQWKAEETEKVKAKPGEWATVKVVNEDTKELDDLPTRAEGYRQLAVPLHLGSEAIDSSPNQARGLGE